LCTAAYKVLKDIDQRLRSLPPGEAEEIMRQCDALLEARICLINRDEEDPTTLSDQRQDRMRTAIDTLRKTIPLSTPKSKQPQLAKRSGQFNAIQSTLNQLSRQLASELRATLSEVQKESPAPPKLKKLSTVRDIVSALGAKDNKREMSVFLQSISSSLTLVQEIEQDSDKGLLIPALVHNEEQILRQRHAELRECLSGLLPNDQKQTLKNAKQVAFESMTSDQQEEIRNFILGIQGFERHLQLSLDLYDDYRSPNSIESICHGRQCEIKAAINVLKADGETKHKSLITQLDHRYAALEHLKIAPGDISIAKLLGEKEFSGVNRFIHPINNARQALNVEKAASRLLKNTDTPQENVDPRTLALDGFSEPMLMRALLKKSGIADATEKHRRANREVLDQQPWNIIQSEIVVPVQGDGVMNLQQLESVATPASHVLANPERVVHATTNSVLTPASANDFIHQDAQGESVRGGFISHDLAESTHALMAAHDELRADGKLLFGATRHAVNAPFGLPDELKSMPAQAAAEFILQLLGPATRTATAETIHYPSAARGGNPNPTNVPPPANSTVPPAVLSNDIREAFRSRLQALLDREYQLLEGLNETGILPSEPNTMKISADDLLNTPELATQLAERVLKDTELMQLLVRQGALNRAREVILMEIARSPVLGSKIAAGDSVLFGSIALLTPDHVRHLIASISEGNSSLDEKVMLEVQVQAYKDLQKEIDSGGLVINGQRVKAKILPFNWGVNELSLLKPGNDPVVGSLINGHDVSNVLCNQESLTLLVGLPDEAPKSDIANETERFLASARKRLTELEAAQPSADNQDEIAGLKEALEVIPQLRDQIRQIWSEGSYRFKGNEPYKMPARIALLMHYLGGGTLFNCKSGKDRTGQLSVEVKALAVRIMANQGRVPLPDQPLSAIEQIQYGALTFVDKTRAELQRYATGYAGSKLGAARQLLDNLFAHADGLKGRALEQLNRERLREFLGLSKRTKA
ncbi:MAG: inositol phosphate phosphatase SopB, partial [Betaproteobacteria bacterium]